eukprot:753484-Hanusia_phi.AAC.2
MEVSTRFMRAPCPSTRRGAAGASREPCHGKERQRPPSLMPLHPCLPSHSMPALSRNLKELRGPSEA